VSSVFESSDSGVVGSQPTGELTLCIPSV